MQKILPFLVFLSIFVSGAQVYASYELHVASVLSRQEIISDQRENPADFRFQDTITRQEVIGIAVKVFNLKLPRDYQCKGYYQDAIFTLRSQDAWVCRAAELAADNDIITRQNSYVRPQSLVTRSEALAMLMVAGDLSVDPEESFNLQMELVGVNSWQLKLLKRAHSYDILKPNDFLIQDQVWNFEANKSATRGEVFDFAYRILKKREQVDNFLFFLQ